VKKVAVIGSVGLPASYGGFETLVENIIDRKIEFTVYCSGKHYQKRYKKYKGAFLVYVPIKANGISSIFYDVFSILHAIFNGHKTILVLGYPAAILFPIIRLLKPSLKIVTNIDGMEWKRAKWKKFASIYLRFSERLAVKFSQIVISDNKVISDYVKKKYGVICKTIPYGGDHAFLKNSTLKKNVFLQNKKPFAFALSRIEPENNSHLILDAFKKSSLQLVYIGNWQASEYGINLKKDFKNFENIKMLDPIFDKEELFKYRYLCSFYLHGHSAGGTNPSLVEMMHFAKPIIAFDCSFNRETLQNKGNYFNTVESLESLIKNIDHLFDGEELRKIARERYTWEKIRKQYIEIVTS
tara:strand:- start:3122 stop:4183 length:1062 start_codon:yes stop_codon:yes gene_type:complete